MRKIIIFSFILFTINFLNAQVCDKINCENIKDYITIKIIEETVKTDPNEESLEEYFKKNTIETPFKYSEFATILNANKFPQTREKLGDAINSITIKTNYTKEEFASKIMEDVASKLNDKQKEACNFDKLEGKLIDEINTYLVDKIKVSDVQKDNAVNESNDIDVGQIIDNQNTMMEKSSFFSFSNFNFFTLLSLLIPIVLFFILMIRIDSLNKKNERRKEEIRNLNPSPSSNQISKAVFENLLNNSMVFREFHEAIENLQKQTSNNMQLEIVTVNQNKQQTVVSSPNIPDVFYMKYPVENSFSNNNKSLTKENTIYKFFLKANKSEADFEIHTEGAKIDEIISMVERTIKTGCDEDNNPSVNTRNIITLIKGIVSLEGDKWVIKRKALIRYE